MIARLGLDFDRNLVLLSWVRAMYRRSHRFAFPQNVVMKNAGVGEVLFVNLIIIGLSFFLWLISSGQVPASETDELTTTFVRRGDAARLSLHSVVSQVNSSNIKQPNLICIASLACQLACYEAPLPAVWEYGRFRLSLEG